MYLNWHLGQCKCPSSYVHDHTLMFIILTGCIISGMLSVSNLFISMYDIGMYLRHSMLRMTVIFRCHTVDIVPLNKSRQFSKTPMRSSMISQLFQCFIITCKQRWHTSCGWHSLGNLYSCQLGCTGRNVPLPHITRACLTSGRKTTRKKSLVT